MSFLTIGLRLLGCFWVAAKTCGCAVVIDVENKSFSSDSDIVIDVGAYSIDQQILVTISSTLIQLQTVPVTVLHINNLHSHSSSSSRKKHKKHRSSSSSSSSSCSHSKSNKHHGHHRHHKHHKGHGHHGHHGHHEHHGHHHEHHGHHYGHHHSTSFTLGSIIFSNHDDDYHRIATIKTGLVLNIDYNDEPVFDDGGTAGNPIGGGGASSVTVSSVTASSVTLGDSAVTKTVTLPGDVVTVSMDQITVTVTEPTSHHSHYKQNNQQIVKVTKGGRNVVRRTSRTDFTSSASIASLSWLTMVLAIVLL